MKVVYSTEALNSELVNISNSCSIGFVPTMGALHQGHIRLIERSIQENEFTICSIFVNQKQFNNPDDFLNYPKTIESDLLKLKEANCNLVLVPSNDEIYPANFISQHYELGNIENILEGLYRPGHFQGVCIVVNRLLDLVKPKIIYLGKKDYQQCKVIQKMVEIQDLDSKVAIGFVETEREPSGLAMSSRNQRLSIDAKNKATVLIKSLKKAKELFTNKADSDFNEIKKQSINDILNSGFESVDYFELINEKFEVISNRKQANNTIVILTAATIEGVRLIDNIEININDDTK